MPAKFLRFFYRMKKASLVSLHGNYYSVYLIANRLCVGELNGIDALLQSVSVNIRRSIFTLSVLHVFLVL